MALVAPKDIKAGTLNPTVLVNTASTGDNDTSIASTAFVQQELTANQATFSATDFTNTGTVQNPIIELAVSPATKQNVLVSGTNIKTVNGTTLLGSGNLPVQDVLVSNINIKTINGNSLLGSGDLVISGGGSQTPWSSNIDGAQYNLSNVKQLEVKKVVTGSTTFATFEPTGIQFFTLSNGNLTATKLAGANSLVKSNMGFTTGTHTIEITIGAKSDVASIGIGNASSTLLQIGGQTAGSYAYWSVGDFFGTGAPVAGAAWTTGDKLQIAFDGDNHLVRFYKNGVFQGQFASLPTEEYYFFVGGQDNVPLCAFTVNTGQTAFTNTIPGYTVGWFTGVVPSTTRVIESDINGNIGIGVIPDVTDKVKVNGNLQLNGELKMASDPGSANQALISRGVGLTPVWRDSTAWEQVVLSTVDATPQTFLLKTLTNTAAEVGIIEINVVAVNESGVGFLVGSKKMRIYASDGVTSTIGTVTNTFPTELGTLTTASWTLSNTGLNLYVGYTGEAATNITWKFDYKYLNLVTTP